MFLDSLVPIPKLFGKISRQTTKSGTYIHYILERTYDPKKRHTVPKRVIIGKAADEEGMMYPNEKFATYFPATPLPEARPTAKRSSTLMAGPYMVINSIAKSSGLDVILQKHFEKRAGLVLDLASYMIVEGRNQGQHFPDYAYRHPLFSDNMRIASDSTISSFLNDVTDDQISGFLNDWNAKSNHKSRIYVSYDSTNKNSQAGDIDFVEFGKAKIDQGLPIFNLGVAFDMSNRVPLFYEMYPGSVNDVSQFQFLVDKAIAYNYRRIGFILDRGYFSKANIAYMDQHKYEFVMMVKGCKPLVSGLVDELRNSFEDSVENSLRPLSISGVTAVRKLYPEDSKDRYFHLFFNPMKKAIERRKIDETLDQMEKFFERCVGKEVTFSAPYTDYFELNYDKKKRFLFAKLKKDVVEAEYARCGYFCIVTSEKMTAKEAYLLYRGRDASEKLFSADKSFLGSKSMRVHSNESLAAKIFIEFIALIIRQRIYTLLKDEMLRLPVKKNYMTVQAAIKELEKIELVRINDQQYQLDHAVTKTQETILRSFAMTKDDVLAQSAVIAQALKEADGNGVAAPTEVSCGEDDGDLSDDGEDCDDDEA